MPGKAGTTTQSVTIAERDSENAVWLFGTLFISIHCTQYVLSFGNHWLQLAKMLD
jgi:hypothetical protein